jgi:hypothetical protein
MRKSILLIVLELALAAGAALAQNNPLITVNEQGVGSLLFPGIPGIPLNGVVIADPGPGGLSNALTYNLLGPPAIVAGDLVIQELIGAALVGSDLIRFNPAGTGSPGYPTSLVFYSDIGEGADSLADKGFPTSMYTNVLTVTEVGPEGNNGFLYTPTANQPGFVPGFGVTYNIISDQTQVPEPASASLVVIAGGMYLVAIRLRKGRAK